MAIPSIASEARHFQVYVDSISPVQPRLACSAPGLRKTGSSKQPLAVRNSNTMLRASSSAVKGLSNPAFQNSASSMSQASVATIPSLDSAHALPNSPLDFLPQRIKDFFIEQSFVSARAMSDRDQLIVAADALDVRSKLMQTEVPLSVLPRSSVDSGISNAYLMPRTTDLKKPKVVLPLDLNHQTGQTAFSTAFGSGQLNSPLTPSFMPSCPPPTRSVTPMLSLYATVKISNIPWDASTDQIVEFLGKNTRLAIYTSVCSPVHFVLDRTSGKTQSEIFLELGSLGDAERFAQRKTGKTLGTRNVNIEIVSSKEMLLATFPRARGSQWVTQEEIQNLLTHAKTFKSPYTRKCPQRPFENFISILCLFPWANKSVYAQPQAELLFAGYSSLVSILQWHIRKGKIPSLDTSLLRRLIIAGTNLTDFTPDQKRVICSLVGFYPEATVHLPPIPIMSPALQERKNREDDNSKYSASLSVPEIHVTEHQPSTAMSWILSGHRSLPRDEDLSPHPVVKRASDGTKLLETVQDASKFAESLIRLQDKERASQQLPRHCRPFSREGRPSNAYLARTLSTESCPSGAPWSPPSKLEPRDQWLLNARKAGIVVELPKQ